MGLTLTVGGLWSSIVPLLVLYSRNVLPIYVLIENQTGSMSMQNNDLCRVNGTGINPG